MTTRRGPRLRVVPAFTWLAIGVSLLPLLPLLLWSVAGRWPFPALVPTRLTSRGLNLLSDPGGQIVHGLLLSSGIAAVVATLACLVGFPAGRAIGLYQFRGRRLVHFLLLAPVIVPGLAVALGLEVFFVRYGLADSVVGVVLVQLMPTVPYTATVLAAAFANFDPDYERQARLLGARPASVLLFVTLPLLRPALLAAATFAFLISWTEYVLTVLVGGGQVQTLPLMLFAAIGSSDTTAAAALAVVVIAPPLLLVAALGRVLTGRADAVIGFGRL